MRATNPYDLDLSTRKLVGLASVLATDPAAVVLDEPTTGQDGPGVARVGRIIDALQAAGKSVVAITHDMEFAAAHFGRIVVMRQGEVVADGPPSSVFGPANLELLASTGLHAAAGGARRRTDGPALRAGRRGSAACERHGRALRHAIRLEPLVPVGPVTAAADGLG